MAKAKPTDPAGVRQWLADEWIGHFRAAIESMAGEPVQVELLDKAAAPSSDSPFHWNQPFSLASGAHAIVSAGRAVWHGIGGKILAAAGIEDAVDDDTRPTYQEILQQSLSGLASSITSLCGREITCPPGKAVQSDVPAEFTVRCSLGSLEALEVSFSFSDSMIQALLPAPASDAPAASQPGSESKTTAAPAAIAPAPSEIRTSQTIEILYDVELPVSISFGRAHLALREVIKLATGSIVELNRTVNEPVELIVNNCVIARGEVVVVEGNYGVRIQQIVNHRERLRTLH